MHKEKLHFCFVFVYVANYKQRVKYERPFPLLETAKKGHMKYVFNMVCCNIEIQTHKFIDYLIIMSRNLIEFLKKS